MPAEPNVRGCVDSLEITSSLFGFFHGKKPEKYSNCLLAGCKNPQKISYQILDVVNVKLSRFLMEQI